MPVVRARAAVLGVVVGVALALAFLAGALVLTRIPDLRDPVQALLDHADRGIFPVVLTLALVNGVAEEFFFRGALYDALHLYAPIVSTTVVTPSSPPPQVSGCSRSPASCSVACVP